MLFDSLAFTLFVVAAYVVFSFLVFFAACLIWHRDWNGSNLVKASAALFYPREYLFKRENRDLKERPQFMTRRTLFKHTPKLWAASVILFWPFRLAANVFLLIALATYKILVWVPLPPPSPCCRIITEIDRQIYRMNRRREAAAPAEKAQIAAVVRLLKKERKALFQKNEMTEIGPPPDEDPSDRVS